MAVPRANKFYRAVLEVFSKSGRSMSAPEMVAAISDHLKLTDEQLAEMVPSGIKSRVEDRTQWAMYHLKNAALLESPSRGIFRITNKGIQFLRDQAGEVTNKQITEMERSEGREPDLLLTNPGSSSSSKGWQFLQDDLPEGDAEVDGGISVPQVELQEDPTDVLTPYEVMDICYREQQKMLMDEILDSLRSVAPSSFERLVVELLANMGYGDGKVTGRTGDRGIDGVLNQDALGLEKVYVQAKRFDYAQVGEPEIRNFSGSLDPFGASKGVFITTSSFSNTARQTAENISRGGKFIRLIDGQELAELMMISGVGVVTEVTYEVKKLDANYFTDL